ncbi:hypothetical protein DPMN_009315 [Dreissena polymorpha]|uniref:Uncharacterized protein n=1 Tax=Dreissena polymorpha TaxID=45954 RepID=A0A9D4MZD4_DREPO|nr:hypothetical protein DPMN_009315 [Dreissena polymorpha]
MFHDRFELSTGLYDVNRGTHLHVDAKGRTKRSSECRGLRTRALCPWKYETVVDRTYVPSRLRIVKCESSTVQIPNSIIQCEEVYTLQHVRIHDCVGDEDSCERDIQIPVGCVAARPCVVPAYE